MSLKYQYMAALYEQTCQRITSSSSEWKSFLNTACRNYKLRFDEQVLLYAQKPDATAVLEIEKWNDLFGRRVHKGTTGIAVFERKGKTETQRLVHYFDISDTYEWRRPRPVPIWEMKKEYEQDIARELSEMYSITDVSSLPEIILRSSQAATKQYISDNAVIEEAFANGNTFGNLSEEALETMLFKTVSNSAAYMVLKRLNINTDDNIDPSAFEYLSFFNTDEYLLHIGIATNEISQSTLSSISKAILAIERKNTIHHHINNTERKTENEQHREDRNNVHTAGGLLFAQSDTSRTTEGEIGALRRSEMRLLRESPQGQVLQPLDEMQTDRTLGTDRTGSIGVRGNADGADDEGAGRDRTTESGRSDDLGRQDEQYQKQREGDSFEGSYIPNLNYYDPEYNDKKNIPLFGNDDAIREMFATSPHLKVTKQEIRIFLETVTDEDEREKYITGVFNTDYTEVILKDESRVGYKTYENGLLVWAGSYPSRTKQTFYSWNMVVKYFEAMKLLNELYDVRKPMRSAETQLSIFIENEQKSLEFTFSQEIIDAVICTGSRVNNGKMRIYHQFLSQKSKSENIAFLKKEYGWGGSLPIILCTGIDELHDQSGIKLSKRFGHEEKVLKLSWDRVEKRISELIKYDRYLNPKEKQQYTVWLNDQKAKTDNRYEIFQIENEELSREYKFEPYERLIATGHTVSPDNYEFVYSGKLMPDMKLDDIYTKFNIEIPEDYTGHSLSVSDVIVIHENGKSTAYYVDSVGFKDVSDLFLKITATKLPKDNMTGERISTPRGSFAVTSMTKEEMEDAGYGFHHRSSDGKFDIMGNGTNAFAIEVRNEKNVIKKELEYHIGDKVYIGADEYEILSIGDDRIVLFDAKAPIINKEISKDDFEQAIQDNPINDHLIVKTTQMSESDTVSPLYQGYLDIKSGEADRLLLYRVGDFFEAYNEDAKKIASLLDLTLVSRPIGSKRAAMVGLPIHSLEKYADQINSKGFDVVVYDTESKEKKIYSATPSEAFEKIENTASSSDDENDSINTDANEDKNETQISPASKLKKHVSKSFDLYPDIPTSERHNFDLLNNPVEETGKKERFKRNIAAINVLKECESEKRYATPAEQLILSKYVGWGGIPEAFDENNASWSKEYNELRSSLSADEYTAARESTLTAFYTPPEVIQAVYTVIENAGFTEGNILEPSCGIGHFIGMLPDSLSGSKVYGVEMDKISASIAQQLYQKNTIAAQPFEQTQLHDSFFDVVVGNVPFGDFKVSDKRYDKHNFLIHDYFFAKSLDKLRPGGIMALITSKGTMDKENSSVRRYIAQRAELLGAVRLPNNAFKGNAGTDVVSDIIFLQKRERNIVTDPEWIYLKETTDGIKINSYFADHPEMILGKMQIVSGRYGPEASCVPFDNVDFKTLLNNAVNNIHSEITAPYVVTEAEDDNGIETIPADPSVRNFSFAVVDNQIYYRENSIMQRSDASGTKAERIMKMIQIRDSVRRLIDYQKNNYEDEYITAEQKTLNRLYDDFIKKYGLINSKSNSSVFRADSSFPLLSSLEELNERGELLRKADIFSKRTIKPIVPHTYADTSAEALAISMNEKACVDMDFMVQLTGKSEEQIFSDLESAIYLNPLFITGVEAVKYLPADEYLSGNVRQKLEFVKSLSVNYPDMFNANINALEKVIPKDLTAGEISVRLGATWIPKDVIQSFVYDLMDTPTYTINAGFYTVSYSSLTSEWNISDKSKDKYSIKATNTYGTNRINAYHIIEETLNLRDVRVFDYFEDEYGKKKAVLNKKDTAIAQAKQEAVKQAFQEWIWKDANRRERLTKLYNQMFNSIRPREYDGSNIEFVGMNASIKLREHQRNAIAHILYGGNTLLAHAVGAGKTFEMTAAAMELKRLGLCNKSMFVVPNHLTEQWASEFLQLYPTANILVARKKDFEPANRKKFCGRIATGDYDAVIIGHSQFEKIPMSLEKQKAFIEDQITEITTGIAEAKKDNESTITIKQLERTKKSLLFKLEKLNDRSRKDDVVTFEELGVDRIFVDESHYYKNLFLYTKMRNVGGIAQTEAQKSSDLFMKCRYLDEITGNRGVIFATGTPISNSMVELYTIQRYLQYDTLVQHNLQHFDAWASTFGETVTAVELTPEGTGYRAKTRFARFYNLPELMSMFKEAADIKTADMLNLPVPKVTFHNISVKPSKFQKEMVAALAERAEKVRSGTVDPRKDNMLKITNDGRKLALDQRLINPDLPDYPESKLNACADIIYEKWEKGKEKRLTQLFFCDLSTPKNDGEFSVYTDIKEKLVLRGVPSEEIQFIHDANTDVKKDELFKKVRSGDVRILMGSTAKMGAGTNVQKKLCASYDLDCPWRPSDLEQRLGRIVRQGNENEQVDVYRFVTEETFDAYLYQIIEGKQKFASQIMTSKSPVRACDDIDETALSYAEIKMLATGNPYIKEKMDLDIQVQKLRVLKSNYLSEKYDLEDRISKHLPREIGRINCTISGLQSDIETASHHPLSSDVEFLGMTVNGITYNLKSEAGKAIAEACKAIEDCNPVRIGEYRGFALELHFDVLTNQHLLKLVGALKYEISAARANAGTIDRLDSLIADLSKRLESNQQVRATLQNQLEDAKAQVEKPFEHEKELQAKTSRLDELNILLNLDSKDSVIFSDNEDVADVECNVDLPSRSPVPETELPTEPQTVIPQDEFESEEELFKNFASSKLSVALAMDALKEHPETLINYVLFAQRFVGYSLRNIQMLYAQYPYAKFVAGRGDYLKGLPNEKGEARISSAQIKANAKELYIITCKQKQMFKHPKKEKFLTIKAMTDEEIIQASKEHWKTSFSRMYSITPVYDISQTTCPQEVYSELFDTDKATQNNAETNINALINYAKNVLHCKVLQDCQSNSINPHGYFSSNDNTIHLPSDIASDELLNATIKVVSQVEIYRFNGGKLSSKTELETDIYAVMLKKKFDSPITSADTESLTKHYQAYMSDVKSRPDTLHLLNNDPDNEPFMVSFEHYKIRSSCFDEYGTRQQAIEKQYASRNQTHNTHTDMYDSNNQSTGGHKQ